MSDSKNRQWILAARPTGILTGNEFRWNEAPIPQPADGQLLVRNLWLSFDPTQRGWMARDSYLPMIPLGEVMRAFGVGQVIETRLPEFKKGDLVQGMFGWQDYVATDTQAPGVYVNWRRKCHPMWRSVCSASPAQPHISE
jgi:NADPH-dependent curcumin reductase CurA